MARSHQNRFHQYQHININPVNTSPPIPASSTPSIPAHINPNNAGASSPILTPPMPAMPISNPNGKHYWPSWAFLASSSNLFKRSIRSCCSRCAFSRSNLSCSSLALKEEKKILSVHIQPQVGAVKLVFWRHWTQVHLYRQTVTSENQFHFARLYFMPDAFQQWLSNASHSKDMPTSNCTYAMVNKYFEERSTDVINAPLLMSENLVLLRLRLHLLNFNWVRLAASHVQLMISDAQSQNALVDA